MRFSRVTTISSRLLPRQGMGCLVSLMFLTGTVGWCQCTSANPGSCSMNPARLETNIGPFPLDKYLDPYWRNAPGSSSYPPCDSQHAVRNCVWKMFNNNAGASPPYTDGGISFDANNYVGQGAAGVRFQFGLGGGAQSTPFLFAFNADQYQPFSSSQGSTARYVYQGLDPVWKNKVSTFFSDLYGYGVRRVTPVAAITGYWSGGCGAGCINPTTYYYRSALTNGTACLKLYPWLPFGLMSSNGYPEGLGLNTGYNHASPNPYFWGWQPLLDVISYVLSAAQSAGLDVAELDVENEIDLVEFTVLGRLLFDNQHDINGNPGGTTDVMAQLRTRIQNVFGAGAGSRVTFSTVMDRPTLALGTDDPNTVPVKCNSAYGESASLFRQSALTTAFGGGLFGLPDNIDWTTDQGCNGTLNSLGQPYLPSPYSPVQPAVIDIHAYICAAYRNTTNPDLNNLCIQCHHLNPDGSCVLPVSGQQPNPQLTPASSTIALKFYQDLDGFLQNHGMTSNNIVIGETNPALATNYANPAYDPNNPSTYPAAPPPQLSCVTPAATAYDHVNGFMGFDNSNTFQGVPLLHSTGSITMRPWNNMSSSSCYVLPALIEPPYKP